MKILTQKTEVLSSKGAQSTQFKIAATSKAFSILSSNLYTDRITAIIRELSTNAVDAHIAAKNEHLPFEVSLPTSWEQQFSIRDFGTGLSREQVEHLYTTYFESDKTGSDDFIGGLGLGSKSPFSYTDNFTVVSYHNGQKHVYSMCIEDGYPSCKHLVSEETTEPNGLEITLYTKNDQHEWANKAKEVYKYFERVKPKFVSGAVTIPQPDYERKNDRWAIKRGASNHDDMHVVMGGVCYKVGTNSIDKNKIRLPVGGMTIFANVGDVEIAASRETLHMDHRTVDFINGRIDDYLEETRVALQKQLDACATPWYVYKTLVKFRKQNNDFHTNILNYFYKHQKLKYKGANVDSYPDISLSSMVHGGKTFKMEYIHKYGSKCSKDNAGYSLNPASLDLLVINDTGRKNVDKRVSANLISRAFSQCVFVSFSDILEAQVVPVSHGQATVATVQTAPDKVKYTKEEVQKEFFKVTGIDPNDPMVVYVSKMPAHVAGTNRKYNAPSKVIEFRPNRDGNGVANRAYWKDVELDVAKHNRVWYVPVFESSGIYNTTGNEKDDITVPPEEIGGILRVYEKLTGHKITLYGIRKRSLEKIDKDNPGVLKDFLVEALSVIQGKIKNDDMARKIGTFINLRHSPCLSDDILAEVTKHLAPGTSDFHTHYNLLVKTKGEIASVSGFALNFYELCRNSVLFKKEWDTMVKIATGPKILGNDISDLEDKYPMLGIAGYQRALNLENVKGTVDYINLVNRS